jgi:hypothetical protein
MPRGAVGLRPDDIWSRRTSEKVGGSLSSEVDGSITPRELRDLSDGLDSGKGALLPVNRDRRILLNSEQRTVKAV